MKITSKQYGELEFPDALTQEELEKYWQNLHDITTEGGENKENKEDGWRSPAAFRRITCRAAMRMGWIKEPNWADAKAITWIGKSINDYIASYEIVSPN